MCEHVSECTVIMYVIRPLRCALQTFSCFFTPAEIPSICVCECDYDNTIVTRVTHTLGQVVCMCLAVCASTNQTVMPNACRRRLADAALMD